MPHHADEKETSFCKINSEWKTKKTKGPNTHIYIYIFTSVSSVLNLKSFTFVLFIHEVLSCLNQVS